MLKPIKQTKQMIEYNEAYATYKIAINILEHHSFASFDCPFQRELIEEIATSLKILLQHTDNPEFKDLIDFYQVSK